jgi:hypothetical protein
MSDKLLGNERRDTTRSKGGKETAALHSSENKVWEATNGDASDIRFESNLYRHFPTPIMMINSKWWGSQGDIEILWENTYIFRIIQSHFVLNSCSRNVQDTLVSTIVNDHDLRATVTL